MGKCKKYEVWGEACCFFFSPPSTKRENKPPGNISKLREDLYRREAWVFRVVIKITFKIIDSR